MRVAGHYGLEAGILSQASDCEKKGAGLGSSPADGAV